MKYQDLSFLGVNIDFYFSGLKFLFFSQCQRVVSPVTTTSFHWESKLKIMDLSSRGFW